MSKTIADLQKAPQRVMAIRTSPARGLVRAHRYARRMGEGARL